MLKPYRSVIGQTMARKTIEMMNFVIGEYFYFFSLVFGLKRTFKAQKIL